MSIHLFVEKDRQRWNEFVRNSPQANSYQLIEWKEIIERSFGKRTYYLFSQDGGGRVNGVLPIAHLKSIFFGNFFVSLPYFNYGGVCAENEQVLDELIKESIELARNENVEHVEFRHRKDVLNSFPSKKGKVSLQLALPSSKEELWNQLPSKLRSQVRRPSKEGMYSKVGKLEELSSFYKIFSKNMRDLGTPVYGEDFFKNILMIFEENTWICTIYEKNNLPVASAFLLGFKEVLEVPWASALREWNKFSPNMLLYWSCLEFACENGFEGFDFGRSTPGEGTYKFKEQWGAKPVQLYWHYWLMSGDRMPEINPKNPKYQAAIRIWKKLPVSWTRILGPRVAKNLP